MEKNGKDQNSEENNNNNESDQNNDDSLSSESEEKKKKKLLNKKRNKQKSKEKEDKKKKDNDDIIVNDKEVVFLLDNRKRVTVHKFKGQMKVDIREFYDDKGEMRPGKKGICLSIDNWKKLKGFIDDIDESIDNMK